MVQLKVVLVVQWMGKVLLVQVPGFEEDGWTLPMAVPNVSTTRTARHSLLLYGIRYSFEPEELEPPITYESEGVFYVIYHVKRTTKPKFVDTESLKWIPATDISTGVFPVSPLDKLLVTKVMSQ